MRHFNSYFSSWLLLSVAVSMWSGCSETSLVDAVPQAQSPEPEPEASPVMFAVGQDNNTRATLLQNAGHYNFGVFGYKDTDTVNPVFLNYLVGYYNPDKGYGTPAGSTFGNPDTGQAGVSYWMYEGMGAAEYEGPFGGKPLTDEHRSNLAHQYMRYWDKDSSKTTFYAYAPYVNGPTTATFDNASKLLTLPASSMVDGYDDNARFEYLYATTTVENRDYGNDVYLPFRRLNCRVNIRFYETIEGYTAEIIDLGNGYSDIHATPSALSLGSDGSSHFARGQYYQSAGASVSFATPSPVVNLLSPQAHAGQETLVFARPTETVIGTSADTSTPSATTYYGIPKTEETGGFTFHVSYRLTSDLNEQIVVRNATAFIPADKCNWKPNVAYTYIFKITHDSNGSTNPDDDPTIDPTDPDVPPVTALFPIVFDRCTVDEWATEKTEQEIGNK